MALFVSGYLIIREISSNKTLTVGEDHMLSCFATSNLSPTVEWFRKRPSSSAGYVTTRFTARGNGELQMLDVKVADSGEYVCRAWAGKKMAEKSVHIFVGGKLGQFVELSSVKQRPCSCGCVKAIKNSCSQQL